MTVGPIGQIARAVNDITRAKEFADSGLMTQVEPGHP